MSFSFQSPSLDLGPDVEVCDNGVITFDAGMGWLSTRWFDGSEERTITVWEPGVVSVVVTDSCGNEFYDSVRVTINPTTVLNLGDDITICQGDTAEIGVSGFTTYQWFPQHQVPCVDCPEIEVVPDTATCYILVAGNAAGCYSVDTIKVEIGGDTIYVSDTITICFGDSALIFGSMETIAGKYNMILTSPGGCIIDSTITLDYYGPMALQSTTRPTCGGLSTGSANVLVSGGQPPYQYEWSATNSDSNKVENLPAGIYDVTVSDENNCFLFYRLFIDSMSAPEVDLQVIDVSCFGDDDGELTIVSTNSDLSFSILGDSSFQSENIFNQLPAGSYTLSVMGVLNCIYYFDFNITEPDEISLQLPPDEIIQLGDSVEIIAVTNRVNLIYQWSEEPGLSCRDCPTTIAGPATTTTYQLVVQDSSGCMSSDSITIIVEFNKRVFVPNAFSPNNDGVNDKLLVFAGKELNRVLELNIYNRWGGKVFERVNFPANDQNYGWDGTVEGEVMNPGVFTWWAKVEFLNGDVDVLKGNVTLVK